MSNKINSQYSEYLPFSHPREEEVFARNFAFYYVSGTEKF